MKSHTRRRAILYDFGSSSDYKQVWDFQKKMVERRSSGAVPELLIVTEHSNVITMGRNGHRENLVANLLPLYEIERGGDVTYHGPGQLVVYPIIQLQEHSLDVRGYVQQLEMVITNTLRAFGIESNGKLGEATGVWTLADKKIASIGIALSHWTSYHGLALNVNTDLRYFDMIKPCGYDSRVMTSMERELGIPIEMHRVKKEILENFSAVFQLDLSESHA